MNSLIFGGQLTVETVPASLLVRSHGPRAVGARIKKGNFACVYMGNIRQYDSGEQCGPWAFYFSSPELKAQVSFSDCQLSVLPSVCLSVRL
jgi:hypothetical protein